MNNVRAYFIFEEWKKFQEINDKLVRIFHSLPKSLLPFDPSDIEEALNIVAKDYFDRGDYEMATTIQTTIASLVYYQDDKIAVTELSEWLNLLEKNSRLKKISLDNLRSSYESWEVIKTK